MEDRDKRITAHIIPYKINKGSFSFFLQKRSDDAERNPGGLSMFGGGIEKGETLEQGMLRETKEELNFTPSDYFYLGGYGDDYSVSHYYAVEVNDDFEASIKIDEGDYGRFFTEEEVINETKLSEGNMRVFADLIRRVKNRQKVR